MLEVFFMRWYRMIRFDFVLGDTFQNYVDRIIY